MPKETCKAAAIRCLARRDYAVNELIKALVGKKYSQDDIAEVIDFLEAEKYLNDAQFARSRVRYRAEVSQWGRVRIARELAEKGVAAQWVAQAFEVLENPEDSYDVAHNFQKVACDLVARRFGALEKVLDAPENSYEEKSAAYTARQKEVKRRMDFLIRRGFSLDEAKKALKGSENLVQELDF